MAGVIPLSAPSLSPLGKALMDIFGGNTGGKVYPPGMSSSPRSPAVARPLVPQFPNEAPIPTPRPQVTMPQTQVEPATPIATPPPQMPMPPQMGDVMGEERGIGDMIRAFGRGASQIRTGNGDPYVAFGSGFGGATEHYDINEALAEKRAIDSENLSYERSRTEASDARAIQKDAQDRELQLTQEARLNRAANLTGAKTALEIRRLARANGVTAKEMNDIERTAQAAGENLTGQKRIEAINETRDRLLDAYKAESGGLSGAGFSKADEMNGMDVEGDGLSGEEYVEGDVVQDEAGNVLILRGGEWVTP